MTLTTRLFIGFLIGCSTFCTAQMATYNYKRTLDDVTDEWHKLKLPDDVFGKVKSDLSDLRIYGITVNDTIEAPYLLQILSDHVIHKTKPFNIINKTKGDKGYYFTFQLNSEATINQINLNFKEQNFDWKIELQGSQNQQEWFTLLEDYRILSIRNETTDYKFTKLVFPDAKYSFFRLIVKHNEQPELVSAQLSKHEISGGSFVEHHIKKFETNDVKTIKTTEINLELDQTVSMSQIHVDVSNTFDYYRPLKIEYRNDSVKTEKGWNYYYKTITNATLNSLESNSFNVDNTIAKHLKLTIYNSDNQPLSIDGVSVKGYEYQVIARFTEPADYMLVYGNSSTRRPNYDIARFETKVPKDLRALKVGKEQEILKPEEQTVKPLFENSYWLWGIIGVVILILGGFTLKMLKKS
ncbi:DUF3999 family protein [Winogradskyella psychrotolerans]|uniref:DUF3999 family protein n=1 Tax=Winogradskyella psychrotolerans TaxID=1344585 RepID=UPI001C07BF94|nr:DUF3999 family protein [Winogradskyella psychrotolerans]MBU2928899.1 DUF3999 family protein [Winogradskyella psychrotolerans]